MPGAVWGACVGLGSCSALLPSVAVSWSPVVARGCVLSWAAVLRCSGVPPLVRCAAVVPCCFLRAGWCCVVLPVVAGCSLLGLVLAVVSRWRVLPRVLLPGRVACCPAVCCGLLWCPAPLCCVLCSVVLRCPVVPCCGAVLSVVFLLVVSVCVFSLCVRCCFALRVVLFGAVLVRAVVGAWRCGVSLCVVVSPWAFCGVVVLLWCVVVSCCAVRCPVVSCALCCVLRYCGALRCCAGWLCRAVVCTAGVLFILLSSFPLLKTPAVFPYL